MHSISISTSSSNKESFIKGGGEMGQRIRDYDWSATAVGPMESWPQSLLTTVNLILNSRFPMFIWWGAGLIQFYNDAYRPSLGNDGKHPRALGQRGEECWPEIWPVIYPLIKQVLEGGESTWSEDQLIPIYRNGQLEDVYWTFGYSPIIDENKNIAGVLVVCNENTNRILNHRKLQESEDMLSFAIDAAELGTWDLNPLTNKFTSNARLKSWFGLKPTEEVELPLAISSMIPSDRDRVAAAIQRAMQYSSGGFYDIKYTIVNKDTKEERVVRAKGKALFNAEKIAIRFNGILQDITEQEMARLKTEQIEQEALATQTQYAERLAREVEERTLELQRSNEDLLQFAHVISHDLKEPVRKIKTFAGRIDHELAAGLPPVGHSYLQKIQQATDRMVSMIDGVLKYSTLRSAEEIFVPVDLNQTIKSITSDLEVVIQQKSALINYHSLPTILGSPILLYQLFYNLINNSLKFTRKDVDPVINVSSLIIQEKGRSIVEISVYDNGIGFQQEHADRIFDNFARLHSKDKFEGTGLGLALGRKIVTRHGGTITATGLINEGAIFNIRLPLSE